MYHVIDTGDTYDTCETSARRYLHKRHQRFGCMSHMYAIISEGRFAMGDWIECVDSRGLYQLAMYLLNHLSVQNVYNSVMNSVVFLINMFLA